MMPITRFYKTAFILMALVLSAGPAYALDDGFGSAKTIEGKYTVIYCSPETDVADLILSINIRPSDQILAGRSLDSGASEEEELGLLLDVLQVQVSGILDMHSYGSKISIKICRNHDRLKDIYKQMFNADLQNKQSFYAHALNTIYTSEDSFKREIIGHEMAHAIMSHYFVVPAPIKIQEVLSMYVEYNLRRAE